MHWFLNLKIKSKLFFGFGVILFLLVTISAIQLIELKNLTALFDETSLRYNDAGHVNEIEQSVISFYSEIADAIINKDLNEVETKLPRLKEEILSNIAVVKNIIDTDEERELAEEFEEHYLEYLSLFQNQLIPILKSGEENAGRIKELDEKIDSIRDQTLEPLHKIVVSIENESKESSSNFMSGINTATASLIIFIVLSVIISLVLILFITARIKTPIEQLKAAAQKIISGDLNVTLKSENSDELGMLMNSFGEMAEKIAQQIQYLDNLPAPVMIIDKEYNITYMNKKGAEVVGKDQKSLVGRKCFDQFKTGHCRTENCALHKAMATNKIITEETVAKPNGKNIPILYTGAPIKDRSGNIIGALESVTDITEIKDAQEYLSRCTNNLMLAMDEFAKGDLTISVNPEREGDDIAKLFNGFNHSVKNIKNMISTVREAVQATASASSEISSSSEEMAAGSQEQSAQATEVASAVEQMTTTIIQTTKNASKAADSARKAGDIAKEGGNVVKETVKGMQKISDVVSKAALTVQGLGENSDQIGEIIQVINDIADQTNLLALNAAIEAARAGEQGRGFAVVADEVRKLAERTGKATKEIAVMIETIQKDTKDAVVSINAGTTEVESGKSLAEKAGLSLEQIISASDDVLNEVMQVASASEEQSAAAEQISKNIEAISSVTHQSAAGVQQIAHASEDLNRLTENLQSLTNKFRVDENYSVKSNENTKMIYN